MRRDRSHTLNLFQTLWSLYFFCALVFHPLDGGSSLRARFPVCLLLFFGPSIRSVLYIFIVFVSKVENLAKNYDLNII